MTLSNEALFSECNHSNITPGDVARELRKIIDFTTVEHLPLTKRINLLQARTKVKIGPVPANSDFRYVECLFRWNLIRFYTKDEKLAYSLHYEDVRDALRKFEELKNSTEAV